MHVELPAPSPTRPTLVQQGLAGRGASLPCDTPGALPTPGDRGSWEPLARAGHLFVLVWWSQKHLWPEMKPGQGQILLPKRKVPPTSKMEDLYGLTVTAQCLKDGLSWHGAGTAVPLRWLASISPGPWPPVHSLPCKGQGSHRQQTGTVRLDDLVLNPFVGWDQSGGWGVPMAPDLGSFPLLGVALHFPWGLNPLLLKLHLSQALGLPQLAGSHPPRGPSLWLPPLPVIGVIEVQFSVKSPTGGNSKGRKSVWG